MRAGVILSGAELGGHVGLVAHAAPLLAAQGTADRINPPKYSLQLLRAAGRPKFLLLLGRAGHLGPYTVPGARLAAVEHVSIAFLDHYLGTGRLGSITRAAARVIAILSSATALVLGAFGIYLTFTNYPLFGIALALAIVLLLAHSERKKRQRQREPTERGSSAAREAMML